MFFKKFFIELVACINDVCFVDTDVVAASQLTGPALKDKQIHSVWEHKVFIVV